MGELELGIKRETRNRNIKKMILATVSVAGILSVALVMPNIFVGLKRLGLLPKARDKETINRSRKKLVENGFLVYKNGFLELTEKGRVYLVRAEMADYKLKKPKKWDKKWRVLIFDIKEERKNLRDKIRNTLISIGFARLQYSVWIYPYDCEDFITLLKADFKIGGDVLYMVVDRLENDRWFRGYFNLLD